MIPALNHPLGQEPLIIGGTGNYMVRLNPLMLKCFEVHQFLRFINWFCNTGENLTLEEAVQDAENIESCLLTALSNSIHPRHDTVSDIFEDYNCGLIGNQANEWREMIEHLELWPKLLRGGVYFVVSVVDSDGDFSISTDVVGREMTSLSWGRRALGTDLWVAYALKGGH